MKKEKKLKRTHKTGEMETLAQFYSDNTIEEAIKRKIDKEIKRRDKKERKSFTEKYKVNLERKEQRESYVCRIIEEDGRINEEGITKENYLNDNFLGYKIKKILKSYEVQKNKDPFIQVEHKDTRTDEQKAEDYRRLQKNKKKDSKDKETRIYY